jgi:hypothetical protein
LREQQLGRDEAVLNPPAGLLFTRPLWGRVGTHRKMRDGAG